MLIPILRFWQREKQKGGQRKGSDDSGPVSLILEICARKQLDRPAKEILGSVAVTRAALKCISENHRNRSTLFC